MNNTTMQSLLLAVYIKANDYVLMMEAIELLNDDSEYCEMTKTSGGDILLQIGMMPCHSAPLYIIKITADKVRITKNEDQKKSVLSPVQIGEFLSLLRNDDSFLIIGQVSKIEFILDDAKYVDTMSGRVTVTDRNGNYFCVSKFNGHNSLYLNYQGNDWDYELNNNAHQLAANILK